MADLFLTVLDMSLSASWIILAVLAARLVLKKAPKWMICSLWALVALRLLCPISLESSFSLIPDVDFSQDVPVQNETIPQRAYGEILSSEGEVLVRKPMNPTGKTWGEILSSDGEILVSKELQPSAAAKTGYDTLSLLWGIGILLLLGYAAVSYLRIRSKVQVSIDLGNHVYLCDYIDTPFILGILKPKIYLPSEMDPKDAAHVLSHERAHLKRRDHWWKPLGFVLLSLHWFNPLMWVAYVLLCRDIELACDEKVVRNFAGPEKKAYSEALLKCSVPRHLIAACPLAFGEVSVKQRVKSVLHYKKPRFWIILTTVVIAIVVAVCFLTDPPRHTVATILDLDAEEISEIYLWSHVSRADYESKEKIQNLLDFMDMLEYDPVPAADVPIEGNMDENNWSYQTIDIHHPDREEYILFNYDYTLVWTRDEKGVNSLPYRVKNPELLLEYLNDHVTPVNNRETYAEPFAAFDQPAQWLHKISLDAIRSAKVHNGYLSNARTSEVISILNNLPSPAIGTARFDDNFTFDYRLQSMPYIILRDGANDLTGILTCYNDSIELSLVDSSDYGTSFWEKQQYSGYICSIDSSALISFFEELDKDPPNLLASSASGYEFNEKLEIISDGEFTMSFHTLENWDYEFILPEDGEECFGFRCRPKKENDGWVTFGWWEDYSIPENTQKKRDSAYGNHFFYFDLPADANDDPSYTQSIWQCEHGYFIETHENTDTWDNWYQDTVDWLWAFQNVKCEPSHALTNMSDDLRRELADLAYFDWDSIARQLDTENMTLFDPQYYEGYLFVGLSHDGDYHIACFRQTAAWEYEFVEILDPVSEFLPRDITKTAPVAEFEHEDSLWKMYVIDDETVTGIQCHSGFWGYLSIEEHPALVLLDASQWTDGEITFDLRYQVPPALDFTTQNYGSSFYFHEGFQYYLYDCLVNYDDGTNPPGSYSLEAEELWELADILISMPESITNLYPSEDVDGLLYFDRKTVPKNPQVYMQLRLDDHSLYSWGDSGVHRKPWGDVRLELFYGDDTITLGVNMEDLDQIRYNDIYYFELKSDELKAFMLDKCNNSRKSVSLG